MKAEHEAGFIFESLLDVADRWEEQNKEPEAFKDSVIMNALVNALVAKAMERGFSPNAVLFAVMGTFAANGALIDDEPATVH